MPGEGHLAFHGLDGDRTYRLWIGGLPDGRYVLGTGLRPGTEEVELEILEGHAIQGTILEPDLEGRRHRNVSASVHGFQAPGRVDPDGTFTIRGVPPGTWPVTATVYEETGLWTATAEVATGTSVDLRLTFEEFPHLPR
jgi:hypothetical protein